MFTESFACGLYLSDVLNNSVDDVENPHIM